MNVRNLAGAVRATEGMLLVVTGAGISVASGVPTFRGADANAVWKRDVTELGTRRYFEEDPAGSWSWYLHRFRAIEGARPNAGHRALVELERQREERGRPFLLVTQNIDGLHAEAGSRALIEVHGAARKVRCSQEGCVNGAPRGSLDRESFDLDPFRAEPILAHIPRCPACGAVVRQHVLWFDELYGSHEDYQWPRVLEAAESAALVLFVGTSFAVGVTDLILTGARRRRAPVYSIDPAARPMRGVTCIESPSEQVLPELV